MSADEFKSLVVDATAIDTVDNDRMMTTPLMILHKALAVACQYCNCNDEFTFAACLQEGPKSGPILPEQNLKIEVREYSRKQDVF